MRIKDEDLLDFDSEDYLNIFKRDRADYFRFLFAFTLMYFIFKNMLIQYKKDYYVLYIIFISLIVVFNIYRMVRLFIYYNKYKKVKENGL